MSAQPEFFQSDIPTSRLLTEVKHHDQDFEWYPTTTEILQTIKSDIESRYKYKDDLSVLDCGAGDGRSLRFLTNGKRYAIEKSRPLLDVMDKSIFIIGTEFREQTLIDKKVDVIFCNPPYSEYSQWLIKIIKEANAAIAYLVVPTRWSKNSVVCEMLDKREAEVKVIGQFDFLAADRQARTNVDILRIDLSYSRYHQSNSLKVDPFSIWFNENFKLDINKKESSKFNWSASVSEKTKARLKNEMVAGRDMISILETLYQNDVEQLLSNYKRLENIDAELLNELDVNVDGVKSAMRLKIEGLKDLYWKELFDNLTTITSRLTSRNRSHMLDKLTAHTHVDFTASNAYAIVIWVLKNANIHVDEQLIDYIDRMTERANISLYKSNQITFEEEQWRYCRRPENLSHYQLDYRVVLHRIGGLTRSEYSWESDRNGGLSDCACDFINDMLTIANNLGFDTTDCRRAGDRDWNSGGCHTFDFYCFATKKTHSLMSVRAFLNGNLHIKFNQQFMCRLNVEFGRLKGWLKSPRDAVDELGISIEDAFTGFESNVKLGKKDVSKLGFMDAV